MAIEVVCGECGADYDVPQSLAGKTIKCKACAGPIPIPGAKPAVAKAVRATAAPDDRPTPAAPKARFVDDEPIRPAAPRSGRGNDLPAAPKKSAWPLVLLGLFGLTGVTAAGGAGLHFSGVLDDKPAVVVNNPAPLPWTPPNAEANGPLPGGPRGVNTPPAGDTATSRPSTTPTPGKALAPTLTKPKTKPAVDEADDTPWDEKAPKPSTSAETPGGDGPKKSILPVPLAPKKADPAGEAPQPAAGPRDKMDQLALTRAKNAAVYIEIEVNNGGASGSGWFGMEQNLIFTNAHVLDMKAPNAPKPKKITVWINPGTNKERIIPHSKLEILAVDRFADLAILRVLNETDLPTPLKIRPSAELRDVEPLVVIGYPSGRLMSAMTGSTKAPQVTVNTTSFSTLRTDNDGNATYVQTRGGAAPGNSGGPIIDHDGNVVAVLVAGPTNPGLAAIINYGVPTEMVAGLLAGRVADVEYGQAYRSGGKVKIPVKVNVLDPFQRLKEVGIGAWVGDPSDKNRVPGPERTGVEPSDGPLAETKLTYKWAKDKQVATGEVEFPELQAGRAYWSQPYYKNALSASYWMPGRAVVLKGPPVDLEDVDLLVRLKTGTKRPTTLLSSGFLQEFDEGERTEPEDRQLIQTEIKATETVEKTTDPNAVVQLRLNYETLNWKAATIKGEREDILGKILPKPARDALTQNVKLVQGFGYVRKDGSVYKTLTDLRGTPQFAPVFRQFSDNAMQALENASVPLPNAKVSPKHTWKAERNVRFTLGYFLEDPSKKKDGPADGPGSNRPGQPVRVKEYRYVEDVTYTYLGTRTRVGQKEAVIQVEGVIKPAAGTSAQGGASGSIKGYAYIDIDTGTVLESELKKDFEMDTSSDGVRKVVAGVSNSKITRGTAQ